MPHQDPLRNAYRRRLKAVARITKSQQQIGKLHDRLMQCVSERQAAEIELLKTSREIDCLIAKG
jgi:hypothetical protein